VHPADVSGVHTRRRQVLFALLIGTYVALPWLPIGGHPAVFLDIQHRAFYFFGLSFNAQDVWMLFFLISGLGFALFVLTTVLGRVWCGYTCPQTVFLEAFFRRFERWIEGPRNARLRRNKGPWNRDKLVRKIAKQVVFAVTAAVVANVFISYFVSIPELWAMIDAGPAAHPGAFGVTLIITGALYFNFAWFREQTCVILCPYGRLQSVMTDSDTIIIGYDEQRGEPRGKKGSEGAGDCVDCERCVNVCPTGIDIRNGLQLDCIGCAACVDACNDIMTKVGREKGLVRYDSLRGLRGGKRRYWRPRLGLYAVLGAVGLAVAFFSVSSRSPWEANLLRLKGAPYVVSEGVVTNVFDLRISNKRSATATFTLQPVESSGLQFEIPMLEVELGPMETKTVPIRVSAPSAAAATIKKVQITTKEVESGRDKVVETRFLSPRRR